MSIMENSYGKWLHIMLMLDNAQTHSASAKRHDEARNHQNRLLLEHIQYNEQNPYTKITAIEHSAHTSHLEDSNNNDSAQYINFLISPEVTFFLMKKEIRLYMHMTILSEDACDDRILNSFDINTHSRKNYLWVGPKSDKLVGLP